MTKKELSYVQEVKITYKRKISVANLPKINCSEDAEKAFRLIWDKDQIDLIEDAYVMFLNMNNQVLGIDHLSTGSLKGTIIDIRRAFQAAILANAAAIIIAHNHPSGNLDPSISDKKITKKIKDSGNIIDIKLLDHLILTSESFYSLADNLEL